MSKQRFSTGKTACIALMFTVLVACDAPRTDSSETEIAGSTQQQASTTTPVIVASESEQSSKADAGDSPSPVATLDGEPISMLALDVESQSLVGEAEFVRLDDAVKARVLDAVIARRAIAGVMSNSLDAKSLATVDAETRAYRENLLLKRYLRENAKPGVVTEQMVQNWYDQHPEAFGGGIRRHYTRISMAESERWRAAALGPRIVALADADDLALAVEQLRAEKYDIRAVTGPVNESMLTDTAASTLLSLTIDAPEIIYFGEYPSLVRLDRIEQIEPEPIKSVRPQIRRQLLSAQVREAIDRARAEVVARSSIALSADAKRWQLQVEPEGQSEGQSQGQE